MTRVLMHTLLIAMFSLSLLAGENVVKVRVDGVACRICTTGVHKFLKKDVKGVKKVKINFKEGVVSITMKPGYTAAKEDVFKAIERSGYTPIKMLP